MVFSLLGCLKILLSFSFLLAGNALLPLVYLLRHHDEKVQEHAAGAVRLLAFPPENRFRIIAEGAVLPLIGLLATGSPACARNAAGALWNLSATPSKVVQRAPVKRAAGEDDEEADEGGFESDGEGFVSKPAYNEPVDMTSETRLVSEGILPPLVRALRSKDPALHECGAGILRNLSVNDENKIDIAEEGAITPLIHLLQASSIAQGDKTGGE